MPSAKWRPGSTAGSTSPHHTRPRAHTRSVPRRNASASRGRICAATSNCSAPTCTATDPAPGSGVAYMSHRDRRERPCGERTPALPVEVCATEEQKRKRPVHRVTRQQPPRRRQRDAIRFFIGKHAPTNLVSVAPYCRTCYTTFSGLPIAASTRRFRLQRVGEAAYIEFVTITSPSRTRSPLSASNEFSPIQARSPRHHSIPFAAGRVGHNPRRTTRRTRLAWGRWLSISAFKTRNR